jgi:acyl-coenzyme A thioesterase PaaI-like protein
VSKARPTTSPKIAELAETAMAQKAGQGRIFDLKLSYISDFEPGERLTALADIVHAGRRTVVTECRIEAGGRLVATASATFAITREKGITEGPNAD